MSIIAVLNKLGIDPMLMMDSSGSVSLKTKPSEPTGKAKLLIEINEHVIIETLKGDRDSWIEEWRKSKPLKGDTAQRIYHLWLKEFLLKKYGISVPELTAIDNTPQSGENLIPWGS